MPLTRLWHQVSGRTPVVTIESLMPSLARINAMEASLQSLSDESLCERLAPCRATAGPSAPAATVELVYAIVREMSYRTLGKRPYDVQVLAGLALSRGAIAEMATGEGKTLVVALPATLYALSGKGTHVATVNRYLAGRDCELLKPLYTALGLSTGLVEEKMTPEQRRLAYAADITYGTGYEFGFDYLRDQLALISTPNPVLGDGMRRRFTGGAAPDSGTVQRPLAHAVIDEIDSVLIDEALTPLVISKAGSGPHEAPEIFLSAKAMAQRLEPADYEVDEKARSARLTNEGLKKVYEPSVIRPATGMARAWHQYVEQALRARFCFDIDVHYLEREGKIEIIDEYTGRSFADRKWREGLHQAVEAKESVEISAEMASEVSISRQVFYRMYDRLCGMTGTAREDEAELNSVYELAVIPVPLHRPSQRVTLPDRIFSTWNDKVAAMVLAIQERHATGQPILVGTRTLRQSEELSDLLSARRIPHRVLNARQDAKEAELIGSAGEVGTVTIATNMAGRGADIHLGDGAPERGGLHVIGQERHESRRVDRQLVGRSGRQGNPGSAQFFLSAEDSLLTLHAPEKAKDMARINPGPAGELPAICAEVFREVQLKVEAIQTEQRRQLMAHDRWLEKLKKHL